MAFDPRALVGRPSLRRALSGLDSNAQDELAAFTSDIDPVRFRSQYRDRVRQFLDENRELAAQRAPGLLEQRRQRMQDAYRARNFGAADTGAVDFEADDAVQAGQRQMGLRRRISSF